MARIDTNHHTQPPKSIARKDGAILKKAPPQHHGGDPIFGFALPA